jgi:NADPH:quinone reductase-like Zn-dependent oxidoreductase
MPAAPRHPQPETDLAPTDHEVPDAMRAVTQDRFGGPNVLRISTIPVPRDLEEDQVLVRVHAASVNPYDWHMIRGLPYIARTSAGWRTPKHAVPGADVAGVVVAVGAGVSRFAVGDEVFGGTVGAFAEYAQARAKNLVRKPALVSFEAAASVPMAGITALQALRDTARVQKGDRVLVHGASGGVGMFCVQIAVSLGGTVTGVTSSRNLDLVRSFGAAGVVDYTTKDVTRSGERYDVIIDMVRTHPMASMRRLLAEDGRYASVGAVHIGNWVGPVGMLVKPVLASIGRSQTMKPTLAKHTKDDLELLAGMLDDGRIAPAISRTFSLEATPEAVAHLEGGHATAKVVVVP